ncbi:unnamed protein product [Caenorhabditis bovis]|uniref:Protein vav-1 n=1 Tax=Caenorhabditis bovis TaxID=2654633 RepID=A0A8S1EC28_9PELO|nr:unnamed protein product [Caenorhabditis bovis]
MTAGCELWKSCARWMRDLGLIGTTDENGTMLEFASILRDGVLLCRLANTLIPDSTIISEVNKPVQMSQFTCSKNIIKFLEVCKLLNIKEEDLFVPHDLFFMTGFQKVLRTLSLLSHTPESLSKGVAPFPELDATLQPGPSNTLEQKVEEEDIYQSLTENIENIDPDQTIYGPITRYIGEDQKKEQLYDHIVMTKKNSINENDVSPSMQRMRCIQELFDTEKNYVETALRIIIEKFYIPLRNKIPDDKYETIFSNIERIMELHKLILEDLYYPVQQALGRTEIVARPNSLTAAPQFIGEVFVKHRDGLLEYGQYCSNLMESRKTTNKLMESDPVIKNMILDCTNFENNQFSMQDLLTVPFQRITKYPLLIRELIKKTDVGNPERTSLCDAQEILDDVCEYINDMTRDKETQKFIDEIEESIVDLAMPDGVRLRDYGRVNFDGEVKMVESTATQVGKQKNRFIFIFDKNTSYTYKNAFVINELSVDMNVSIDTRSSGTITRRTQHVIHLYRDRTENNEVVHITLYFKHEAPRQKLLNAFLLAKENVSPTELIKDSNHKVTFTNFIVDLNRPEVCGVCQKLMKGLYYQGYKCNNCHLSMHKSCLGLKKCEAVRRSSENRISHSFNANRPRKAFFKGEVVIANTSFTPSDPTFLQFRKDDQIEVIQVQSGNRFTGCVVNNRSRTGLVNMDRVTKARSTSMIGLNPAMDSPAGSIFGRIDRKESTMLPNRQDSILSDGSISRSSFASRSRSSTLGRTPLQQDYVNTVISEYPWYLGEMERIKAESILRETPNGTFLVRFSKNRNQTAISVSYEHEVKHMIIEETDDGKMFLDEGYIFNSVVELVQYYREHNLIEIFQGLNTTLKYPYLHCKIFRAIHDYEATQPAPEGKFLSLRKGDIVLLIDTVGEDRGWWKGQCNNQSGFFPLSYVQPVTDAESNGSTSQTLTHQS